MIYIVLSIFCSVTVAVLLKLSRRYQINIIQAVTVNYLTALVLCFLFFKPALSSFTSEAPWATYISLAILLPTVFLFLAASIKNLGIVKTDVAQRLSLFIPILASYFIFNETFNQWKLIGLCVGFPAILLTFIRKNRDRQSEGNAGWQYPLLVFLGFGIIDVLFKQIALYKAIAYTSSLFMVFCLAFIVAVLITISLVIVRKTKIQLINLLCGLILGVFNFGNILFYLKAHQALVSNPSTVFASMNLGVIVVGSLIGILVFKEKLGKFNYLGIALALLAVVFITLSQIYAV